MASDTCFACSVKFALATAQIVREEWVNGIKSLFFFLFLYINCQTTFVFEPLDICHIPLLSSSWQCQSNFWAAQSSCAGHGCRKLSWAKLDLLESPTSAVAWLRCHRPLVIISHTPKTVCWQWTSWLKRVSWFAAATEIWKEREYGKYIGHGLWMCISGPYWGRLGWVKGSSVTVPLVKQKHPPRQILHLLKNWMKNSLIMSFWLSLIFWAVFKQKWKLKIGKLTRSIGFT